MDSGRVFTIDTEILKAATDDDDERYGQAIGLCEDIAEAHRIGLDHDDAIHREYAPWLNASKYLTKWYWKIRNRGRACFCHGCLPAPHTSCLLEGLKFHDDDLKFVAVAYNSGHGILVAEESDYTDAVREYLAQELRVTVFSIRGAREKARS